MLGLIIFSVIISSFFFKEKPPAERAFHTVVLAWLIQLVLSILMNGGALLTGEGLARLGITILFAVILFFITWWLYKRRWTDDV
jgi:uncharacterized membrane protein YhaH (DUF805 family)